MGQTRPWQRIALLSFLSAGITLLGLLAGGEHDPATAVRHRDPLAGYYPADMPRYPSVVEVPAGPEARLEAPQGQGLGPTRMSLFHTDDPPQRVAAYYARHFRARGMWVREDLTHLGGVVAAMDVARGRLLQVLLLVRGAKTVAFPSLTTLPAFGATAGSEPQRAPFELMRGSEIVLQQRTRDAGNTAQITIAMQQGATLAEQVTYYEQLLGGLGYRREVATQPRELGALQRVLVYRHEARQAEVTINLFALEPRRVRLHLMLVTADDHKGRR